MKIQNRADISWHINIFNSFPQFQPAIIILPFSYGAMCDVSILITRYCHLYRVKEYQSEKDFNREIGI